jgi:hypothetical protein
MQSLRQELKQLCQTGDAVDVAFAASGTDLHLIVSQLFSGASSSPSMIVMVSWRDRKLGACGVAGFAFQRLRRAG